MTKTITSERFKHEYFLYSEYARHILNMYADAKNENQREYAFEVYLENSEKIEELFSNTRFYKSLIKDKHFISFVKKLHAYDNSITFDIQNACFEVN